MTRERLWQIYCNANPQFVGNGEVTLSAAGLKKLFDQTYDLAFEQGKKSVESKSLFESIFGPSLNGGRK